VVLSEVMTRSGRWEYDSFNYFLAGLTAEVICDVVFLLSHSLPPMTGTPF